MTKKLLWLLALWAFPFASHAHELKLSDSQLTVKGSQALWSHRVHRGDFEVKFGRAAEPQVKAYIPERLSISTHGKPCAFESIDLEKNPAQEWLDLRLRYQCGSDLSPIQVHYDLFYGDPSHRHLMKLTVGEQSSSYTFDPSHTEFEYSGSSRRATIVNFLQLGWEHILIGYDHILFVLALIFGARRFTGLVWLVSSFTLAHSISLALATLGIVALPPRLVEPVIAASIVILALLDLAGGERSRRAMIALAFGFGLVHGLGFSFILQEANLKAGNLAIPLIFFNLGVELGQLGIVCLVYPTTVLLKRLLKVAYGYFRAAALLGIGGMGLYWLIERVLF